MRPSLAIRLLIALAALTLSAFGGYVVVLPPAGQDTVSVYSADLAPAGQVEIPNALKAYARPQGDKLVVTSSNTSAAVTILGVSGGQLSGSNTTLSLESLGASVSQMTPDGRRLLVAANSDNARVFVVNLDTQQATAIQGLSGGRIRDIAVSPDSARLYLLTELGRFSVVDIASGTTLSTGLISNQSKYISVSPGGRVFVTGSSALYEYSAAGSGLMMGQTILSNSEPGRLQFIGGDRYAFANDESGFAVLAVFDLQAKGTAPSGQQPSIALMSRLPIAGASSPFIGARVDAITAHGSGKLLAYVQASKKLYQVSYPVTAADPVSVFNGLGNDGTLAAFAGTDEYPDPISVYLLNGTTLRRFDRKNNLDNATAQIPAGGTINYLPTAAPTGIPVKNSYGYGDLQRVSPGGSMEPYAVRLTAEDGTPLFGRRVDFETSAAGIQLSVTNALTNLEGVALTQVAVAPSTEGAFTVNAIASGAPTVIFTGTVAAGAGGGTPGGGNPGGGENPPPTTPRIYKFSGDGQLVTLGLGFPDDLVVRIVDGTGLPLSGKTVTWASAGPGVPTIISNKTTVTDSNGMARLQWNASGLPQGGSSIIYYSFTATSEYGTSNFKGVAYRLPDQNLTLPEINIEKPVLGTTLQAKLGVPVAGAVRVSVRVIGGILGSEVVRNVSVRAVGDNTDPSKGPVIACAGEELPLSGDDGYVNCQILATGRAGASRFSLYVGGKAKVNTGYMINVAPGDPEPSIVSGNNQNGKFGALLPGQLVGVISDSYGNPIPGTQVSWQVITQGSATLENTTNVSDAQGRVTTSVRLGSIAGSFIIRLTANNKSVDFTVKVESSLRTVRKVSGDGQTAIQGADFTQPLVVETLDEANKPIAGLPVAFVVTGDATLSSTNVVTDSNGRAQVTVKAGTTATGEIIVTATAAGQPAVSFSLTSRKPGPVLTAASFFGASTGEPGITPGGLTFISGQGLVPTLNGQVNAPMFTGRLPLTLAGVSVEFRSPGGNAWAPIYAASNSGGQEAVLIQVPFEIGGDKATVIVHAAGASTTVENVTIKPVIPGFVRDWIGTREQAVVIRPDGRAVTPQNPAKRGEKLVAYATGLGQTEPKAAVTNAIGVAGQNVTKQVVIGVGNAPVTPTAVYLAPNLIGIYAIEFEMPADAEVGENVRFTFFIRPTPAEAVFDLKGTVIAIAQ